MERDPYRWAPSCRRPRGRSTRRRAVKGRLVAHVGLKAAGSATPRAPLPLTPRERIDGLLVSTTMFSRPGSLCTYVPAAYWSCWAQRSPGHFGDKRDGTAGLATSLSICDCSVWDLHFPAAPLARARLRPNPQNARLCPRGAVSNIWVSRVIKI